MQTMKNSLEQTLQNMKARAEKTAKTYRFDIFKGQKDADGKVRKLRSIGAAVLTEGTRTYTVYMKSLLKDVFYLLPEEKKLTQGDFVILTREPSPIPARKYFWNNIGEGHLLEGPNAGMMRLDFDLFGAGDIFMSLHPMKSAQAAAADVSEGAGEEPAVAA